MQPWGSSGLGKPPPWLQPQYQPRFTYQLCVRGKCELLCCMPAHSKLPHRHRAGRASKAQQPGVCCPELLQRNGCSGSVGSRYPCSLQLDSELLKSLLLALSQQTGEQGHEQAAPTSVSGKLCSLLHFCHPNLTQRKSLPEVMAAKRRDRSLSPAWEEEEPPAQGLWHTSVSGSKASQAQSYSSYQLKDHLSTLCLSDAGEAFLKQQKLQQ